jgi:hypothetical protein
MRNGPYIGEVVVTQYSQNNLWMTVPVVLQVEAPGTAYFDSVPGALSFFRTTTETPAAQSIPIRNAGTGTLNWTASGPQLLFRRQSSIVSRTGKPREGIWASPS